MGVRGIFRGVASGSEPGFTRSLSTLVLGACVAAGALWGCTSADEARGGFAGTDATGGGGAGVGAGSGGSAPVGGGAAPVGAGGAGSAATGGAAEDSADGGGQAPDSFDPTRVLDIAFTLAPADWDALRFQSRSATILEGDCLARPFESPFTSFHADVTVDGVTVQDVGLRKKGFLGSLDTDKPSLKVSLDEYGDRSLFGVKDVTLNNAHQDPSLVNQCIGYGVFAAAGVPAPRCNFARVAVNGQALGVYAHVEPVKKPLLRRHFSSDAGNLYEGTLSDFREGWLATFDRKTNALDPSRADLQAIADAVLAPDAELIARLEAKVDLDAFLTFWAVEVLLEHQDGYTRNANNFYVYLNPSDGRAVFLPWGIDQLFGMADGSERKPPAPVYTVGILANRLYQHPLGRQRFEDRLRHVLATAWDPVGIVAELDRMEALLRPFVPAGDRDAMSAGIEQTRQRVRERRATLEAQLAAGAAEVSPPREPICLTDIGSVSGTFDTTWGTVGASDPFAAGKGTVNAVVNGVAWSVAPGFVGAVAGPSDDPTSDKATVVLPALRLDGMLGFVFFAVEPSRMKPGDITLDLSSSAGLVVESNPNDPADKGHTVGALLGGTLHFDAAAMTPGAPVKGSFTSKLVKTSFLP